jgi:hypothetical protein
MSTLDRVAKLSTTDGKMPKTSVPAADTHSVVQMPALGGGSLNMPSPGSFMYIMTMMRK